eukprot:329240-Pelagomonas_calceolata.AAC.1
MLSSFAHPDRQHKARESLHKVSMQPGQSVTDYVWYFNLLLQRAGDPTPSVADQIVFFHTGLLSYTKDKTTTNPDTGKFWTDLHALQEYAINLHTHGANKSATLIPASARTFASNKPTHSGTKRVAFAQAQQFKKSKHANPAGGSKGAAPGPSNPRPPQQQAPPSSKEEAHRQMLALERKAREAKQKYEAHEEK